MSSVALHDSPSRHRHPHHLTRTSAVGCIPADMEKVMQYEILQPDSNRPIRLVRASFLANEVVNTDATDVDMECFRWNVNRSFKNHS
jgi:hypothetical protein